MNTEGDSLKRLKRLKGIARFSRWMLHVARVRIPMHTSSLSRAFAFGSAFAFAYAFVLVASLPAQTAKPLPAWGPLAPSTGSVGFSFWIERDTSRTKDGHARVVQVSVWYPSTGPALTPRLSVADYVALIGTEKGDSATDSTSARAIRGFIDLLVANKLPRDDVVQWLGSPMHARLDAARAARTTRPIVLVAQGNGHTAYNQAVLCEYLASKGYIVVTTPSPLRLGARLAGDSDIFVVAAVQAADLEFAMRATVKHGLGDSLRVATVGHSFGARASLLLLDHRRATLLMSLDGGIANEQGRTWLERTQFAAANVRGSIVHFYQEGDSTVIPEFTNIRALSGTDRTLVRVSDLKHWGFTSFGVSAASFPTVAPGTTTRASERASADVMISTGCVLDAWSRSQVQSAAYAGVPACISGLSGFSLRERLPATARTR